jgi:soluble lytic murein transglycosylase
MNTHDETARPSSRRFFRGGLIIVLIIAMAFSAGALYVFDRIEMLWYPRKYQSEVDAAAAKYGMEPNLIYAIIKAESDFSETAVSSAGAIGLMQILPDTFIFDIRENIGLSDARSSVLFEAEKNILAGTYYFAYWYDYFIRTYDLKAPVVEALAAYNAGISNVWKWLEDSSLHDWRGLYADKIPFEETRTYVERVLKYKEKYDELYGKGVLSTGYLSEALAYRWACRYGKDYNMDPRFVMAIIRAESSFNPKDFSRSGAAGLMQITEGTYADIKGDLNLSEKYEDLFDPEFNIKCGTYYLHWVDERMDGYEQIAAAYTSGLTAVKGWLGDSSYSSDGETLIVENIPNDTTRRYVGYVMAYYEEYCAQFPNF